MRLKILERCRIYFRGGITERTYKYLSVKPNVCLCQVSKKFTCLKTNPIAIPHTQTKFLNLFLRIGG